MAHSKQVSVKPTATEAAIKEIEANIAQPAKESRAEAQQGETVPAMQDLKPSGELVEEWDKAWESGKETAISTGFPALDDLLDGGLYPGLYSMGAITSLGKTTFALQIADYIAASFDTRERLLAALRENDIAIPFAQMDVHVIKE